MKFWTFCFLKIHLWMDDFFWIYFCFLFICMHAYIFFFENAYINGIFGNAYTMYEILEKCIRDFVNAYVDIHKLILFLWKYKHENLFFIFFQIFHFFLIITHEWMLEIVISKFFNDKHECLLYIVFFLFFFNDNLCSNVLFFLKKVCINFQERMYIQRCYFFSQTFIGECIYKIFSITMYVQKVFFPKTT